MNHPPESGCRELCILLTAIKGPILQQNGHICRTFKPGCASKSLACVQPWWSCVSSLYDEAPVTAQQSPIYRITSAGQGVICEWRPRSSPLIIRAKRRLGWWTVLITPRQTLQTIFENSCFLLWGKIVKLRNHSRPSNSQPLLWKASWIQIHISTNDDTYRQKLLLGSCSNTQMAKRRLLGPYQRRRIGLEGK